MNHTPLNYALWLLGRRDRSVGEIEEKLSAKKYTVEEIKKSISFLRKQGFLDDARFAKHYIENQLSVKPLGKYQLKMKLKRKFIADEIIEKTITEIGPDREMELAREATSKWLKRQNYESGIMNHGEQHKNMEKLTRHLLSRGFEWETIKIILEKYKTKLKN